MAISHVINQSEGNELRSSMSAIDFDGAFVTGIGSTLGITAATTLDGVEVDAPVSDEIGHDLVHDLGRSVAHLEDVHVDYCPHPGVPCLSGCLHWCDAPGACCQVGARVDVDVDGAFQQVPALLD